MKKSNLSAHFCATRCGRLLLLGILVMFAFASCDNAILTPEQGIAQSESGSGSGSDQSEPGSESGSGQSDPGTNSEVPTRELFVSELLRFNADDTATNDRFGRSVAIDGEYAIVGVASDDDGGVSAGSAYIYVFDSSSSTWTQEAKLNANDAHAGDNFGSSVAIDGEYVIVGANQDSNEGANAGSAYIFKRDAGTSTWTQEARLIADDADSYDNFGETVAIADGYVAIGSPRASIRTISSGAVYIFKRNDSNSTWGQHAKIGSSGATINDNFGYTLALDGGYLVVGAPQVNRGLLSNSGAAYVFKHDSATSIWEQQASLIASDGNAGDHFGWSVSISGEYAIIGANQDDDGGINAGSAYVFTRRGVLWNQEAKLVGNDSDTADSFGHSVSIHGNNAIIGAYLANDGGINAGAAYVFTRTDSTWEQEARISTGAGAAERDAFAESVAIGAEHAIVGIPRADYAGTDTGSVSIYSLFRTQ